MKKYLVAAFLVLAGNTLFAESRGVPTGPITALPTAAYGGVTISTALATANNLLLFSGPGSVAWIHVSSAQHAVGGDYFIVRDTDTLVIGAINGSTPAGETADTTTNQEVYRHYTSSSDISGGLTGTPIFGYTLRFDPPIKVKRGAAVKFNSGRQGMVTVGHTQFNKN